MSEAKLHPSRNTFFDDSALDTAAEALTGLTVSQAADLAWTSLTALAVGDTYDMVIHHRAIVLLALQVKPLRDWLLVRAVNYEDLSLACPANWCGSSPKHPRRCRHLQDGTIGQTKTRKSRSVPPPVPTYEALKPQLVGRGRQADLWISDLGEPLLYRAFRYRWKKIIRAAALGWEPTAHDLRPYYASRLIHQGVDVVRVAGYLGHANVTKTLNIYGYLMGQDHSDVNAAFAELPSSDGL